jgi:PAS domain S-box-containing protein
VDLGIDQLFMADWVRFGNAPQGRMALTSAMGWTLSGLAVVAMSRSQPPLPAPRVALTGVVGAVVTTLGLVTCGLYFTNVMAAEGWGRTTQAMAVHAAFGLALVGVGFLAWVWQRSDQWQNGLPLWLPAMASASVLTATLVLWQALLMHQHDLPVAARTGLPTVLLTSGVLMTVIVAVIVFLAQQARRQERETRAANHALEREIAARTTAEAALRESEERFRLFMDYSPSIAWMKDEHGRYVYFNRTYEQRFGVRLADWRGKTDHDMWPPEVAEVFRKNDEAVLAAGRALEVTEDTVDPDGTQRKWWNFKFPFQDDTGQRYVAGMGVDITAQKAAETALRTLTAELEQRVQERTTAMQTSEERLRLSLQAARMGIWEWDLTTDAVIWSPEMEALYGLAPGTFAGPYEAMLACVHPDDRERLRLAESNTLAQGLENYEQEFRVVRPDGAVRWLLSKGRVHYDAGRRAVRVRGAVVDISDLKKAEEASLRLAAIVASSDDAIVSKTLNGVVTSWNAAAERMFGYRAEEMIGQSILRIIPDDRQHEEPEILRRLRRGELIEHFETVRRTKDGRLLNVSVTISPLRDERGTIIGASKIARDITARKAAEDALAQHARDLARAHADLRQVAYASAHDLQEPVRQLGIYTQWVAKRHQDARDADIQKAIAFIVEGTKRMQAQFTDLMHYLEMEEPGEGVTFTDCEAVLRRALEELKEPIAASGATITHDPLPTLAANAKHLQLVFQELVDNAVKFRDSAPPRVHVWAEREEGGWRFAVRDNGIGIDPESRTQLFGFFRKLQRRTDYPGTGMGLAICKKIVDRHGGRIWVESTPGVGSTFLFTIADRSSRWAARGSDE